MKRLPTKTDGDAYAAAWMAGSVLMELKPGPLPILPKVLWAQIQEWILGWKYAGELREAELPPPGALLLHGPTGTGKTSLARAVLKYMEGFQGCILESHNVIASHLGETAGNLSKAFHLAEHHGAMLVIEEIDALGIDRRQTGDGSASIERRNITIALMRILEGAEVPVIATTNCLDDLDPAIVRRFELQLEVPALDEKGRALILKKILGCDAAPEMVALPLNVSIRQAHRVRRAAFLAEKEALA